MDFIYTVDASAEVPVMLLYKHIGMDEKEGMGIDGAQFAKELHALDAMGKKVISVRINSPGGSVMEGYSICSAILSTNARVDTYLDGIAASIAGVAFLCGRKRIMMDFSLWMCHDPYGGDGEALARMKDSIASLIASRINRPIEYVKQLMAKETWMDASDAINMELVTDVEITSESNKKNLAAARNDAKKFWKEAALIMNKVKGFSIDKVNNQQKDITINDTMNPLKGINGKLGLQDEAADYVAIRAIDEIQNKLKDSEKNLTETVNKLTETSNKLSAKEKELKEKQDEYDKMKASFDAKEKELTDLKKAVQDEKDKKDAADKAKEEAEAKNFDEKLDKVCARLITTPHPITKKKLENTPDAIKKAKDEFKAKIKVAPESTLAEISNILGEKPEEKKAAYVELGKSTTLQEGTFAKAAMADISNKIGLNN